MPLRRLFLLALLCALAPAPPAAADPPGFAFLEVPAGARGAALAGAFTSIAEGAEAAFWNPAGLATVERLEVAGAHTEYLQSLRHEQFAIAAPFLGGGIAGALRAMYSEPIVARDELGNETGTFGAHDLEFALAWGIAAGERWRWGVSAQVVRERIDELAATTMAVHAGATWDPAAVPGVRLAASVHNLGPDAAYTFDGVEGAPVPLPMAVQAGGSWGRRIAGAWEARGALEARATRGRNAVGMLGAELGHASGAALRAGWRANDDAAAFSAGAGWRLGRVRFDYAFVPYRLDLGTTHRMAFVATF